MTFDFDAEGNVICRPLVTFQSAMIAGTALLVRIEYAASLQALVPGAELEAVQLALTPVQAREFAADLLRLAEKAERPERGKLPN